MHQAEGDLEPARKNYHRFLNHFENGEIDRDLVREASAQLR